MGVLIVIDGVDASGKETQTRLLKARLEEEGKQVRMLSFPAYDSPSSALVKMYLEGKFGTNPEDVNAYAASTFFAADRYATFKTDWEKDYKSDMVILADRYVSSNMIHQGGKISDLAQKDKFLSWLYDFEHKIYGLPEPDKTVFLDMPVNWGLKLMNDRVNKITGKEAKDIHESSGEYLQKSYDNAIYISDKFGWERVVCADENGIRSIEDIHNEIYEKIAGVING